ncbi:Hypothetical Protein FCC1311_085922 [Hondaea fermentalgiana]|uniref:Uncharacterized protein n=1 Tax=Hondaea fermentalgiana TaxID=2315210 RepID=A0A2R5GN92_9STRA|nr:Hypothetical Protein FCC1311_085922 [Hondaea fermentalgiana]|eukprot:GBG32367.1 Hypothetical Protein FCC1311_085922 [Hondaea fermentalgiana]
MVSVYFVGRTSKLGFTALYVVLFALTLAYALDGGSVQLYHTKSSLDCDVDSDDDSSTCVLAFGVERSVGSSVRAASLLAVLFPTLALLELLRVHYAGHETAKAAWKDTVACVAQDALSVGAWTLVVALVVGVQEVKLLCALEVLVLGAQVLRAAHVHCTVPPAIVAVAATQTLVVQICLCAACYYFMYKSYRYAPVQVPVFLVIFEGFRGLEWAICLRVDAPGYELCEYERGRAADAAQHARNLHRAVMHASQFGAFLAASRIKSVTYL